MTRQRSLKARVRARMAKTGEAYTTARRNLLSRATPPEQPTDAAPADGTAGSDGAAEARPTPRRFSDDVVLARTGKHWEEWFAVLDGWGATERPHPEIARWLEAEFGIGGWWAQTVTVEYERARGMRDYYQRRAQRTDYTTSASRTVNVPVERLFEAFADEPLRASWLGVPSVSVRGSRPHRSMSFELGDRPGRVVVGFTAKGAEKSMVAIQHERLPDRDASDAAKRWWTARLAELKRVLEEAG